MTKLPCCLIWEVTEIIWKMQRFFFSLLLFLTLIDMIHSWASPKARFDFKDPAASFEKSCWYVTGSVDLSALDQSTMFHQKPPPKKNMISQQIHLFKQLLLFTFFCPCNCQTAHYTMFLSLDWNHVSWSVRKMCVFTTATCISHWTYHYFRSWFSHVALPFPLFALALLPQ